MWIIILAILVFSSLALVASKQPFLALVTIPAILPSYVLRLKIFILPTTILEVAILGILFGIILYNFKKNNWKKTQKIIKDIYKENRNLFFLLLFIFIISIVAIFVSPDLMKALGLARAYFWESIILFFLFIIYWNKSAIHQSIYSLLTANILILIMGFYQYYTRTGLVELQSDGLSHNLRITGVFDYPNALGLFIAPLCIFIIYLFLKAWKEGKYISLLFYFLLFLGNVFLILFAQSEAALMALAISLFIYAISYKPLRIITITGSIILTCVIWQQGYFPRLYKKLTLQDFSGVIRQNIYMESADMLKDNFLFGAGLGAYQDALEDYHLDVLIMKDKHGNEFEQPVEIYLYPHNIFFNFWTELGFFGMLIFAFLFIHYIFKYYILYYKKGKLLNLTLSIVLLTIFIHGLFDVPYFKNDLAILFWYVLAVGLVFNSKLKTHSES